MHQVLRLHPGKTIVVCTGHDDPESITTVSLLIGGFMILGQDMDVETVRRCFEPIRHRFLGFCDPGSRIDPRNLTIDDCWRALHRARNEDWIDLTQKIRPGPQHFGSFDLEEYAHYSKRENGGVWMLVPGKVIVFRRPVDHSGHYHWNYSADRGYDFSSAFYANLFREIYDVSVVLRLGQTTDSYDSSAFYNSQIEFEELPVGPQACGLLNALDRFLAIAQVAPGQIAIHNGMDGSGFTGTLVVGYLTHRLRFDCNAAVAWIRMVQPDLLVPAQKEEWDLTPSPALTRCCTLPSPAPPPQPPAGPEVIPGERKQSDAPFQRARSECFGAWYSLDQ